MEKPTFRQSYFLLIFLHAALAFATTSIRSIASPPNPLPPTNPRCIDDPAWMSREFKPKDCFNVLLRYQAQEIPDSHGHIIPIEFLAPGTPGVTVFTRAMTPRKYYFGMPRTAVFLLYGWMIKRSSANDVCSCSWRKLHAGYSNAQLLRPERAWATVWGDIRRKRCVFLQRRRVLCNQRCERMHIQSLTAQRDRWYDRGFALSERCGLGITR